MWAFFLLQSLLLFSETEPVLRSALVVLPQYFAMIPFFKYHGAGNDFILIDNRQHLLPRIATDLYANWCNRRLGIGADGLILLQEHPTADFEMVYYNADGHEGSLCGNGGRCAVAFAKKIGLIQQGHTRFWAADGWHEAHILTDQRIRLGMSPVSNWQQYEPVPNPNPKDKHIDYILDTGSPHYIRFVDKLADINVYTEGQQLRYSPAFAEKGINVNFVQINTPNQLSIATYERGVEAETLACGTGAVAAAVSYALKTHKNGTCSIVLQAKGGLLQVDFEADAEQHVFDKIWLTGGATRVFEGKIQNV